MGRISESLPPFLGKLLVLTSKNEINTAKWSADGKVFIVVNEDRFNTELKKLFRGTTQTFIRQLHFYGFKKVDVTQEQGVWGFTHEKGLFIQGNTEKVKDIRRKTKVDPESQRIASYYEVQALRSQLSFLQQIIEDLRTRLRNMNANRTETGKTLEKRASEIFPTSDSLELKPLIPKKRQRVKTETSPSFEQLCAEVAFPEADNLENLPSMSSIFRSNSFSSLVDLDDNKMELFTDIFSDLELEPLSYEMDLEESEKKVAEAADLISEATSVKKADVQKVLSFLSQLSLKDQNTVLESEMEVFPGCNKLEDLVPRVTKVGVGAS